MSTAVVKAGKCAWTGSAKPDAVHEDPPRLRAGTTSHAFLRFRSPVPDGDSVATSSLRVVVAAGAAGSVTFTLKRVTSRPQWDNLTWNSEPTVTSTGSVAVVVSSPTDGTAVTFDTANLMQTIAGGAANFGWRVEADAGVKLYGFDSQHPPKLTVDSVSQPARPTDIRPAGVGSVDKPHITFTAPDITGEAEVQAVRVLLSTSSSPATDANGVWTSPTFDTGAVTATTPDLDLAATAYGGLADGATIYGQVLWQSGGVWSKPSDTFSYTRTAWGTLTITNPAAGAVEEPTPPLLATYPAGVRRYRMTVTNAADPTSVVAESGWLDGASATTIAWTPTVPLQDATSYSLTVDVQDATKRAPSPGDPDYLRATSTFTTTFVGTVTAPTLATVAQHPTLPFPRLTFTRSTTPDSFAIRRDGVVIATDLDPAALFTSGTTYQWTDTVNGSTASHTYEVAAVVNGQRSAWSSAVTADVFPRGLWLVSTDLQRSIVLLDATADNWQVNDETALFRVVGARGQVQIDGALGDMEGTVGGVVVANPLTTATAAQMVANLDTIRESREPVIMVAPDFISTVRLRNVLVRPHADRRSNQDIRAVSFAFIEDAG